MKVNNSIGCTVEECKHHDHSQNLCTLNHIDIVKHEANATCPECTDCSNFEKC